MKSAILAGAMTLAIGTAALAQDRNWVVGSRATGKCEIVTENPVIHPQFGGDVWFGSGPYNSVDDAKLARRGISACPPEPPQNGESDGGARDRRD